MDVFFASVATQAKDDDFEPSKRAFGGVRCDLGGRNGGGFGEMSVTSVGLSLDLDQAGLEEDIHGEASVPGVTGIIFEPSNERLSAVKGAQPLAPEGRDLFLLEFLPACGVDLDAHLGLERRGKFAEQMEPCGIEGLDLHTGGFAEVLSDDIQEIIALRGEGEPVFCVSVKCRGRGFLLAEEEQMKVVEGGFFELCEQSLVFLSETFAKQDDGGRVVLEQGGCLGWIEQEADAIAGFFDGLEESIAAGGIEIEQPDIGVVVYGSSACFGGVGVAQQETPLRPILKDLEGGCGEVVLVIDAGDLAFFDVYGGAFVVVVENKNGVLLCV